MHRTPRSPFARLLLGLAAATWLVACGGSAPPPAEPGTVLLFSDVHFNPFYDPTLCPALAAAAPEDWPAIFATSTITGPGTWGDETNHPLLVRALAGLRERSGQASLALFGGDMLTHGFAAAYASACNDPDPAAMRRFTLKTVRYFALQVREALGTIPVAYTLGNNDTYEGNYQVTPDGGFLADSAEFLYSDLLLGIADHATYLRTWTAGGYYVADPGPGSPLLVVLNSIFFSPNSTAAGEEAIRAELDWLETTLAGAAASGRSAWLLLHIPPGADIFGTQGLLDGAGKLADARMMWKADAQARFLSILSVHGATVTAGFFGHTHMDEYRLPLTVMIGTPAVSPVYGNDPAFKVVTRASGTVPGDYTAMHLDLESPTSAFAPAYTFSTGYGMAAPLPEALPALAARMPVSASAQGEYRARYYSGHDAASPITDLRWPVYWCGVVWTSRQDVVDCVNAYHWQAVR